MKQNEKLSKGTGKTEILYSNSDTKKEIFKRRSLLFKRRPSSVSIFHTIDRRKIQ